MMRAQRMAPLLAALIPMICLAQPAPQPETLPGADSYVYKTVSDVELRLHVFAQEASEDEAAVVFFFGGGWRQGSVSQFLPQARHLQQRGMTAILADYRVSGRHGSTVFDAIGDARSAMRWVRANADKLGIDPQRIAAGGGSAGGHLAAATALLSSFDDSGDDPAIAAEPAALALFNPAVNTGGIGANRSDQFLGKAMDASPFHHLEPGLPPTLIVHGHDDQTVPFAHVEQFCQRAKGNGDRCGLIGYEGAGHGFFNKGRNDDIWYKATLEEMDSFFTELGYLPAPTPADSP